MDRTLAYITRQVARIVLPDHMRTGTATDGSTTTLEDTNGLTLPDAWFDRGTLWMLSGVNAGRVLLITGHRNHSLTFATAWLVSSGDRYAAFRSTYPYEILKQKVNEALGDTYVEYEDDDLTGDGTTLEFDLPTDIYDVREVWIVNPSNDIESYRSGHWKPINRKLRFDRGYPPENGWNILLKYREQHDELIDYDDKVDELIDLNWLRYTAAFNVLNWGMGVYKAQVDYRIEERLNFVLEKLKELRPRTTAPDIFETTAEG